MLAIILLAFLALILFGFGFTLHFLWIVAAICAVVWLIGFAAHGGSHRWYYW